MVEVMIIRPEHEIGMGCCGGVCGDGFIEMKDEFAHHQKDRDMLGKIYMESVENYGDQIQITFVDPRNMLTSLFYFSRQTKEGTISVKEAFYYFFFKTKLNAIFINGRYLKNVENYHNVIQQECAIYG